MPNLPKLGIETLVQVVAVAGLFNEKAHEREFGGEVTGVMFFFSHIYSLSEYIWL